MFFYHSKRQSSGLGCLSAVTDAEGNVVAQVTSDDNGHRLRQVAADGTTTLYINSAYRVVKTISTTTIEKVLYDHSGAVASIISGQGSRLLLYFRRDRKGSVTHCFDEGGAVSSRLAYDAFGQVTIISGSPPDIPRYESRTWDEKTGLYDFGSRYYDPLLGAFLTPDTRLGGSDEAEINGWNRFAFELNNPLNYLDMDGHAAWWIAGLTIGLLAIASGIAIVATAGAATGLVAVGWGIASGALISGGMTAVAYSYEHRSNFSWKDYGIQVGVSAGIGALAGGLMAGVSAPIAASAHPIAYFALASGAVSAAQEASTTALTELAEGEQISLSSVATSATKGFAIGATKGFMIGTFKPTATAMFKSMYTRFTSSFASEGISVLDDAADPYAIEMTSLAGEPQVVAGG
jgi:RHS repeat-associated protein